MTSFKLIILGVEIGGLARAWVDGFRPQCSGEHVGITASLAQDLRLFSLRSLGDYVGSTPFVGCISPFFPAPEIALLHAGMH